MVSAASRVLRRHIEDLRAQLEQLPEEQREALKDTILELIRKAEKAIDDMESSEAFVE